MVFMSLEISKYLIQGLHGKGAHRDLTDLLPRIFSQDARRRISQFPHSCWEILHHIYVWQAGIVQALNGKEVDWHKLENEDNWPTPDQMEKDEQWDVLVQKFIKSLKEMESAIEKVNLLEKTSSFGNMTGIQAVLSIIEHNSYHMGQMVVLLKELGLFNVFSD